MSLLGKFKLGSKSVRPVGTTLETGDTSSGPSAMGNLAIKIGIFLALIVVSMLTFRRGSDFEYAVVVDDVWRWDDLVSPYDYPILKTEEEQAADIREIRISTLPIFIVSEDITRVFQESLDSVSVVLEDVLSLYADFRISQSRGRINEAIQDSLSFVRARSEITLQLSDQQWDDLQESYANSVPGYSSASRTQSTQTLDQEIVSLVWNTGTPLLRRGVIDISRESVYATRITVRNEETPFQSPATLAALLTTEEAFSSAQARFQNRYPNNSSRAALAMVLFSATFSASHRYDRLGTEALWAEQERTLSPTISVVRANEIIVRKGDIVSEDILQRLVSLEGQQRQRNASSLSWTRFSGQLILTISTYLIFFLFLFLLREPIFSDNRMLFLIALLFFAIMGMFGVALRYPLLNMYVVPIAIVAILLTVIFDSRVGIFGTLTMALMGSHVLDYDFAFMYATLFACTIGIFSVRDIRNRGQFFISAGLVLSGYLAILVATYLLQNKTLDRLTDEMIFVALNSALLLMAYPLLWVFERTFNITTDLTLLELSDTNRPLLKEMSLKAPGTFNHVLQVANLAEAAASSIGANGLLTRVGALYHDIGKTAKAEYFVENQAGLSNPHDHLKPSMSALIICSHVKEGLELARKNKIPNVVQDFIPMHHGTTRIEYFYQRALAQSENKGGAVLDSDFRYPGPKPNSAETAILMLADGVEAAARALDKPTHKRLEGLINSIVDVRMDDGQLDECTLTFADLKRIKESFLTILMGVYHVRVKYPGDADGEREKKDTAVRSGADKGDKSTIPRRNSSDSSSGDMLTEALN